MIALLSPLAQQENIILESVRHGCKLDGKPISHEGCMTD